MLKIKDETGEFFTCTIAEFMADNRDMEQEEKEESGRRHRP